MFSQPLPSGHYHLELRTTNYELRTTIKMLPINIVNRSPYGLPKYATEASAGMDLHAFLDEPVTLGPLERTLIPTGISIELPVGYEARYDRVASSR